MKASSTDRACLHNLVTWLVSDVRSSTGIATTEIHKVDFLGFNYQMEPEESLLLSFRVRLSSEHLHDKLMILHVGRFGRIGHRRQRVVLGNKIVEVIKVTAEAGVKKDVILFQRPSKGGHIDIYNCILLHSGCLAEAH